MITIQDELLDKRAKLTKEQIKELRARNIKVPDHARGAVKRSTKNPILNAMKNSL